MIRTKFLRRPIPPPPPPPYIDRVGIRKTLRISESAILDPSPVDRVGIRKTLRITIV